MFFLDYTSTTTLICVIAFYLTMGIIGYVKKSAWFVTNSVLLNITLLTLHIVLRESLTENALTFNAMIDFFCLAINIPLLLVVDEIETRRELIKNVFESKYKK